MRLARLVVPLAATACLLAGLAAPGLEGAQGQHLQLKRTQVDGNTVLVTIENGSATPKSGTVYVTARLSNGSTQTVSRAFTVAPRSRSTIPVVFSGPVSVVLVVSIVEGPDPVGN